MSQISQSIFKKNWALVIGDGRLNKLRKFFKAKGVKIPSNKAIHEAEEELMVDYKITPSRGNMFFSEVNTYFIVFDRNPETI